MFSKTNKTVSRIMVVALCMIMMVCALSGCVSGTTTEGTEGSTGASPFYIVYIVLIVVVFYFFMIRPEKKRRKQADEMRSSVTVDSYITTIGGIYGKVVNVNDKFITIETGEDRVRIQIAKWGVSSVGKDATEQQ